MRRWKFYPKAIELVLIFLMVTSTAGCNSRQLVIVTITPTPSDTPTPTLTPTLTETATPTITPTYTPIPDIAAQVVGSVTSSSGMFPCGLNNNLLCIPCELEGGNRCNYHYTIIFTEKAGVPATITHIYHQYTKSIFVYSDPYGPYPETIMIPPLGSAVYYGSFENNNDSLEYDLRDCVMTIEFTGQDANGFPLKISTKLSFSSSLTSQIPAYTMTPAVFTISTTPTPTPTVTHPSTAVVLASSIILYEGPGVNYKSPGRLKKAQEVQVIGQYKDCTWLKVAAGEQAQGWIAWDQKNLAMQANCSELPRGTYRPFTGYLTPIVNNGMGKLSVSNGTTSDAVVFLAYTLLDEIGGASHVIYLRPGQSYSISGIMDGFYTVFFTTGSEWDGEKFTVNPSFQRFDQAISFSTYDNTYSSWKLTLNPVVGGNTTTSPVDPEQFPKINP